MPDFDLAIFGADNFINPQNPGALPEEDSSFRSDLDIGDQLTWIGGGESLVITITDDVDDDFDEARSDQTLTFDASFGGIDYSAGQVVTPTYTIEFLGSDGLTYTLSSFNFSPNTNNEEPDAIFWEGAIPPQGTVLTVTAEINPTGATARDYSDFVTCFCSGTMIETVEGPRPVESLKPGDRVRSADGGFAEVLLVPHRRISAAELRRNARLRPVKISAGALGYGLPARDTWVSRQHRFCVSSPICQRMFGTQEALVAAIKLTALPGIYVDEAATDVTYWHLLLEQHEVILANGAPSESFKLGETALEALSPEALEEISTLFPNLEVGLYPKDSARVIPSGRRQKKLIYRHAKNNKPLLSFS